MPELFDGPTDTVFMNGEYISVENGQVIIHEKITPQQDISTDSHAEYELTIKGRAPLAQLVRLGNEQQQPVVLHSPATQFPLYQQPFVAPSDQSMNRRPAASPESWSLGDEDDREQAASERKKPRKKLRASGRTIALVGLIGVGIVAGPTTQLFFAGPEAAKSCAGDGIESILGDPGCFSREFASVAFNAENILNFIPPGQE